MLIYYIVSWNNCNTSHAKYILRHPYLLTMEFYLRSRFGNLFKEDGCIHLQKQASVLMLGFHTQCTEMCHNSNSLWHMVQPFLHECPLHLAT